MLDSVPTTSKQSVWTTLGWAAFLACSWTWCIGMFLPVLLVRDYGVWGWIVFAVPNVIGAAAMAWAIRNVTQSRALVASHIFAARWFSFVTTSFQIFFALWIFSQLGLSHFTTMSAAIALVVLGPMLPFRVQLWAAVIVLLLSYVAWYQCDRAGFTQNPLSLLSNPGPFARDLWYLMPVCVFGFALCPYLDLTFHVARRANTPTAARLSFAIGFGLLFFSMILFTLAYAASVRLRLSIPTVFNNSIGVWWLGIHLMVQLAFTLGVHWRATLATTRRWWLWIAASVIVGGVGVVVSLGGNYRNLNGGEFVYRLFMSFYGLVFPAYVWLCMIPTWRAPVKPTRRQLSVFAAAVLIAAPFYWMGFVEQKMVWLVPGLAIVLLARLLVNRPDRSSTTPTAIPSTLGTDRDSLS